MNLKPLWKLVFIIPTVILFVLFILGWIVRLICQTLTDGEKKDFF